MIKKILCFMLVLVAVSGYAKPKKVKMTKEEIAQNTTKTAISLVNGNNYPSTTIWSLSGVTDDLEGLKEALLAVADENRTIELTLEDVTIIPEEAFSECLSLVTISCPSASSVGRNAFANCSALTTIYLPVAGFIGESAFASCSMLATLALPSAMSIKGAAFMYCESLSTLSLGVDGAGVSDIGQDTFDGFSTESCDLTIKSGVVSVEDDVILTIQDSASYTFSLVNLL